MTSSHSLAPFVGALLGILVGFIIPYIVHTWDQEDTDIELASAYVCGYGDAVADVAKSNLRPNPSCEKIRRELRDNGLDVSNDTGTNRNGK